MAKVLASEYVVRRSFAASTYTGHVLKFVIKNVTECCCKNQLFMLVNPEKQRFF